MSAHMRANAETSTRERQTSPALAVKPELEPTSLFDWSPDHDAFSSELEATIHRSQTYVRNRSHTGRQPATDPAGQRKRKLCEDVSKETNKRKKSEDVSSHYSPRILTHFVLQNER
jgi:hypothetical protein